MEDYSFITSTGLIIADTSNIKTEIENIFKDAFGENISVDPETPQGVLISVLTTVIAGVQRNNAALANQINPNYAGGIYLDAIWKLLGGKREANKATTVSVNLTGVAGTFIPAGRTMRHTTTQVLFSLTGAITLDINGEGIGVFQALEDGPIEVLPGTLTEIVAGVIGWETGTNPGDGIPGAEAQSDSVVRALRRSTLAIEGNSQSEAITSGLYTVLDVSSVHYQENVSDVVIVKNGVTMAPHSIYVCVRGGTDDAVAEMLNLRKGGGCNYNNGPGVNVSVDVTDPSSGQIITVKFDRPNLIQILVRVTIKAITSIQDPAAAVREAILAYANGELDQENGLKIGIPVSCFELGGAINRQFPAIYVSNVETSLVDPLDFTNAVIPIAVYEQALIIDSNISVVII